MNDTEICFVPDCGKPAVDYAAQPTKPALRLPLCRECADRWRAVETLYDATHTSAKVLATMEAMNVGHFVSLRNLETGAVTFLGKGQIRKNPALYDDAIARGEVVVGFWALERGVASAPDRVAYAPVVKAYGIDPDELLGHVVAYCEAQFGLKMTGKKVN